jgi:hypothetical protein
MGDDFFLRSAGATLCAGLVDVGSSEASWAGMVSMGRGAPWVKKGCGPTSKPNGPNSTHPTISLPGDSLALRRMLPLVAMPVV